MKSKIFFSFLLTILFFFTIPILWHEFNLHLLSKRFDQITPPPGSKEVLKINKVGLLHSGNGNNCSYLVGKVYFHKNRIPLDEFYKDKFISSIGSPDRENKTICKVQILRLDQEFLQASSHDINVSFFDHDVFQTLKEFAPPSNRVGEYFFLYCADTMYPTNFDFRCT